MNYKFLELNNIKANKGNMIVLEEYKESLPFSIKRVFYMYGCDKNIIRGNHSNRNSKFLFICVSGTCKISIKDTFEEKTFLLNSPTKALYIDKLIWKEMYDFSENAVLMVLSDHLYDPEEYIYDYRLLQDIMRKEKND